MNVGENGQDWPPPRNSHKKVEIMQEQLLSPQEVADWLHVSVDWVQAHATRKEPRLGCTKIGKLLRFKKPVVAQFIEDAEIKGRVQ
jgi:hypothetical protein